MWVSVMSINKDGNGNGNEIGNGRQNAPRYNIIIYARDDESVSYTHLTLPTIYSV